MKVMHFGYSDSQGGAAKAAYRIHKGLIKLGADSQMVVSRKFTGDPSVSTPPGLINKFWKRLTPFADSFLNKLSDSHELSPAFFGTNALSTIPRFQPDIVQLHWICGGFLRVESIAQIKQPVVWRLADMWAFSGAEHYVGTDLRYTTGYTKENRPPNEHGLDINRWTWRRKKQTWSKISNLTIVTPSQWLARCAHKSKLFENRKIMVIPTGQDTKAFFPMEKYKARSKYNLPLDKKLILFGAESSTSDRRKGYHLLIDALKILSKNKSVQDFELVVFGSKKDENLSQLNINAHFLGSLKGSENLCAAYSAADVFIAPSIEENLANTVIESMACGTPVVAFNIGGMPDIVLHQKTGYLATPFSVEELAQGIVWTTDKSVRENISEAARQIVVTNFNVDHQAKQYLNLYEEILANLRNTN